jgi:ZIP family zinc transporter
MTPYQTLLNIVLLSLVASMGTALGGFIAILRKPGQRLYGLLMGITAGVMICLSFLQLVNKAWELGGFSAATIGFGMGASFMFLIDSLAPHIRFGEQEIPNASSTIEDYPQVSPSDRRHGRRFGQRHWVRGQQHGRTVDLHLLQTGLLLAVGITIHNLPEGISVGAGYMYNPQFGMFVAIAILLHNIPEGIATALPLCRSGINRWSAFRVAFLSGLAEPVGALVAFLFLQSFSNLVPYALAFAGGVMVFITLDELVPTAREYGHQHYTAAGIILGSLFVFVLSGIFGI